MYLTKEELDFLIQLENELGSSEGWTERVRTLWELIERAEQRRRKINARTKEIVAAKRKLDKTYARKKK